MRYFLLLLATFFSVGCSTPDHFNATDLTGSSIGMDFALKDQSGKQRRLSDFKGKVAIVFFGYTQCPDVCPTTLSSLQETLKLLGKDADRVQVLFITLDPERDTAALLAQYVPSFHPSFLGLRGSAAETEAIAKAFKVFYKKQEGAMPGNYSIDHSTGSYVYDPSGRLRLYLKYGETPQRIAADVRTLLAGK
ncbi:MAG TPA: SCO family protein [Rugosibacter sp.]